MIAKWEENKLSQNFEKILYKYERAVDQDYKNPSHHRVIIVGAGPVGLSAAIDLTLHGVEVIVIDESEKVSSGSRAICVSKRTLEISKSLCNGNVVSILEGGYDLKALQESTQRHVEALIEFNW